MTDPDIEHMGGGPGFLSLAPPAFLPSTILFSMDTKCFFGFVEWNVIF